MVLAHHAPVREAYEPLQAREVPVPVPGPNDLLVRVTCCGVCHTELDEIEGRLPPPSLPVVLGHEVVGRVAEMGAGVSKHAVGDRVGVGWIHHSSGARDENLSPAFRATGYDVNGGYAEYLTVPEDYAYPIPDAFRDEEAAPLLCAGAIGYRALRLTGLEDGAPLGLTGFGASAHLVAQLARHRFPESDLYVFARDPDQRRFALELGAAWAGDTADRSPVALKAIIDTTPVWKPVVEALPNLEPGGRLVINAIRKEDVDKEQLLRINYHDDLWMEREIKTVANITRFDIAEFLPLAAEIPIRPQVETYPLSDANRALYELRRGAGRGAKVLVI